MTLEDEDVAVSSQGHSFKVPHKTILTKKDLDGFLGSEAKSQLLNFLQDLAASVRGKTLRTTLEPLSQTLTHLNGLLDELMLNVDEIPPQPSPSRYGNPAFGTWHEAMIKKSKNEQKALPDLLDFLPAPAIAELSTYLAHSFGDKKRIDYGTGHELNFLIFLFCLSRLGLLNKEQDYAAVVIGVFWKYITLMRKLQFTYWLEPAGSHGVWGLDDYHFLPFLFGASQLATHKHLTPKCIHNDEILQEFSKDYMYLSCVQFVNKVKTASLRWHSPMLDDISSAKSWDKIASGMFKMYEAEVLGKLPIMQHMLFGSLFSFYGSDPTEFREGEDGHVHAQGQEFPDCCGIRVPSAIAVANAQERTGMRKPLPFD